MHQWRRMLAYGFAAAAFAFLVLPVFTLIPASFSPTSYIQLAPQKYSLRWYEVFAADREWRTALSNSLLIALIATPMALIIGTLAAFAVERLLGWKKALASGLFLAPMIVPHVITGLALYYAMRWSGLSGTLLSIAVGHAVIAVPFVMLNVGVALKSLNPNLAKAAAGLGAGPLRVLWTVVLPGIFPGLAAGALFSFIISFDEVVVSVFLSSFQNKPLPVKLFEVVRVDLSPTAAVAAVLMLIFTLLVVPLVRMLEKRQAQESHKS